MKFSNIKLSVKDYNSNISNALHRARIAILTVATTYILFVVIGIVMVHSGSSFALAYRDKLVMKAVKSDPAMIAHGKRNNVRAALIDFSSNLILGAVPSTIAGTGVVFPYPIAAFRGWIGGIVSVDNAHQSRLVGKQGVYYLLVIILQLIPYSLAGGAGVYLGYSWFKARVPGSKAYWWPIPRQAWLDVLRIYTIVIPLFLIASLVEFCWVT